MTIKESIQSFWHETTRRYKPTELQEHISKTYRGMRRATVIFACSWPLILWLYGLFVFNIELQGSMSAYYHTPMRNWFVGVCFILGVLLWVYRGFGRLENWLLNVAGVCAVLVALFPTGTTYAKFHGLFAIIFFSCCAFVCAVESRHTLAGHPHAKRYRTIYIALGILMFVLPITAWVVSVWINASQPGGRGTWLFWVELFAVEVFATYWFVKTCEIGSHDIDLATKGKISFVPAAPQSAH